MRRLARIAALAATIGIVALFATRFALPGPLDGLLRAALCMTVGVALLTTFLHLASLFDMLERNIWGSIARAEGWGLCVLAANSALAWLWSGLLLACRILPVIVMVALLVLQSGAVVLLIAAAIAFNRVAWPSSGNKLGTP